MKYLFYIGLILGVFACSQNNNESIPKHVIQPDKMSEVLLDIQLMKSHIAQERVIDPYVLDSVNAFYNAVYKEHNITKTDFDTSIAYYSHHLHIFDSIYSNVFAELKSLELELKDVKYNVPNIKYLSRDELIKALKLYEVKNYIAQDSVDFLLARDSLNNFIKHNISLLDSSEISPHQLRNSFAVYANSKKRMNDLKRDLR